MSLIKGDRVEHADEFWTVTSVWNTNTEGHMCGLLRLVDEVEVNIDGLLRPGRKR